MPQPTGTFPPIHISHIGALFQTEKPTVHVIRKFSNFEKHSHTPRAALSFLSVTNIHANNFQLLIPKRHNELSNLNAENKACPHIVHCCP